MPLAVIVVAMTRAPVWFFFPDGHTPLFVTDAFDCRTRERCCIRPAALPARGWSLLLPTVSNLLVVHGRRPSARWPVATRFREMVCAPMQRGHGRNRGFRVFHRSVRGLDPGLAAGLISND